MYYTFYLVVQTFIHSLEKFKLIVLFKGQLTKWFSFTFLVVVVFLAAFFSAADFLDVVVLRLEDDITLDPDWEFLEPWNPKTDVIYWILGTLLPGSKQ